MAIVAKHGKNSLIYINASEVIGGNAWSLNITHDTAEYGYFGHDWKRILSGLLGWNGSLTVWHDQDAQILQTAAVYDGLMALLVYPDNSDITTYYSGNAVFDMASSGDMNSVIGQTANFTGDTTLAVTGFA